MSKFDFRRLFRRPWWVLLLLAIVSAIFSFIGEDLGFGRFSPWVLIGMASAFGISWIWGGFGEFGAPRFRRVDLFDFTPKKASVKVTTNDVPAPPVETPTADPDGHESATAGPGEAFADGVETVDVVITWDENPATTSSFTHPISGAFPGHKAEHLMVTLFGVGEPPYQAHAMLVHAVDESLPYDFSPGIYPV